MRCAEVGEAEDAEDAEDEEADAALPRTDGTGRGPIAQGATTYPINMLRFLILDLLLITQHLHRCGILYKKEIVILTN